MSEPHKVPLVDATFKGALTALDVVEDELEALRQKHPDNAERQAAYDAVGAMLVRVRCYLADAVEEDAGEGGK